MSIRRSRAVWIAAAVLTTAVVGAALVQVSGASDTTPATTRSVASETPSPDRPAVPEPKSTSTSTSPPTAQATPGTGPPTDEPSPGSNPVPTEVQPRDETLAAGPTTLPPSEPLPDPVSLPFPDTASATGKLVKGFPTRTIPQAPDSTIENSSVAAEGGRLQVTLSAESSLDVADVLDFYRTELAKVGMYDTPAPALSGTSALMFARGDHTVTLSATAVKGGCRYAILGTFTAPS